jgi:hypothetical protein
MIRAEGRKQSSHGKHQEEDFGERLNGSKIELVSRNENHREHSMIKMGKSTLVSSKEVINNRFP